MPKMVTKTVNGRKLTQRQFREKLVETVREADPATGANTGFVLERWGDDTWYSRENRYLLSHTLANLERRGLLLKHARGHYIVNQSRVDAFGTASTDSTEIDLVTFLASRGGYAKLSQIMQHFGAEKGAQNDPTYRHVHRIVNTSPHLVLLDKTYDNRGGWWRLSAAKLAHLPLTGELFCLLHEDGLNRRAATADDLAGRLAHVGETFGVALICRDSSWTQALKDVEALRALAPDWAKRWDSVLTTEYGPPDDPYDLTDGEEALRLRLEGFSDMQIIEARRTAREQRQADMPLEVLRAFSHGDVAAHRTAPLAFYVAMGRYLGLDAAQLSRGVTQKATGLDDENSDLADSLTAEEI